MCGGFCADCGRTRPYPRNSTWAAAGRLAARPTDNEGLDNSAWSRSGRPGGHSWRDDGEVGRKQLFSVTDVTQCNYQSVRMVDLKLVGNLTTQFLSNGLYILTSLKRMFQVKSKVLKSFYQRCGSISFWRGSGSSDPHFGIVDPESRIYLLGIVDSNPWIHLLK